MRNVILFLFIIFLFVCKTSFAADTIIVHKDPRLDIFTEKQSEVNKRTSKMTSNGMYRGYRLQVLSTRSREDAFKLKAQLLQMFPKQQSYVVFQSPYFKVRIGNFIHKSDAEDFKTEFSKSYSQSAYVVEDVIEYTPKDEDDISNLN
jgi:SPOR domain